jgi:hypothetical protein
LTFLGARAIIFAMELKLAVEAPHDVVFLDGSLVTPLIYFNQAFSKLDEMPTKFTYRLRNDIKETLYQYREILTSPRSDKIYVGMPKYTSRNDIASLVGLQEYEDRAMLTDVPEGGEFTKPIDLISSETSKGDYWHFVSELNAVADNVTEDIIQAIRQLKVVHYRPYAHIPAFRIETAPRIVRNENRLSIIFEALQLQCGTGMSIMEPYPLYLADRMVKHLSTAVPSIRMAAIQDMIINSSNNGNRNNNIDVFLAMHSYRTESGW